MNLTNRRIGVLMGGTSSEREISLKSGRAVSRALAALKLDVVPVDIQKADRNYCKDLLSSYELDVAFLALHGAFGEDGKIQELLEELSLPYTGSGPRASWLAMDKASSRSIFKKAGLNIPKGWVLDRRHKGTRRIKDFPLVVKPASGGSSIGISIVDNRRELPDALELAFKYDKQVLIEECISGQEMTVGILNDVALDAIEIKPKRRFFDWTAKYGKADTEYIVPAEIPPKTMRLLKDTGVYAHKALGCRFFSRVDIILTDANKPYVLEVNTIPGFADTSLLPKAARCAGIDFPELVLRILQAALWPERA